MNESTGRGRAALVEGDTEFDDRDAVLLAAINRTGSIARAATELGRSRAHALSRIETLEAAFGDLVERHRGGQGGGGSRLTENGATVLDRYERLESVLSMAASVPETVLEGTVRGVTGELARVDTAVGTVQGLHEGVTAGDPVQVRIGADAVTLYDESVTVETDETSARNRLGGRISAIERGETVSTVEVAVDGHSFEALVTEESTGLLDLRAGQQVTRRWKATATRITRQTQRE